MKNTIKAPLFLHIFLIISLLTGSILIQTQSAHAVKIIPPRLVISPDTKLEHMFVKNNSDKKEIYRFSWKHIGMDKQGKVINLDKFGMDKAPGYKALDDIVRFSPRRVVLEPGQTQRVTFLIRRSPNLEAGEYRSHFLVEREPSAQEQTSEAAIDGNNSRVQVDVMVSRAVPIYLLNGDTQANLTILDATLKKNANRTKSHEPQHHVHFDVQKEGNRSVIGQADVFCKTASGEDLKINKATKAFAVYAEGQFRKEKIAVDVPTGGCGTMEIVVKAHPNDVLAGQVLGSKTIKK